MPCKKVRLVSPAQKASKRTWKFRATSALPNFGRGGRLDIPQGFACSRAFDAIAADMLVSDLELYVKVEAALEVLSQEWEILAG